MPQTNQLVIKIGGEAGDGSISSGEVFAHACARMGLHCYTYSNFPSQIRGKHTYFQLRIQERELFSHGDHPDILLAFDKESVDLHLKELGPAGILLYDNSKQNLDLQALQARGLSFYHLPMRELAERETQDKVMKNTVALGALAELVGLEPGAFEGVIAQRFGGRKGREVVEKNLRALQAGAQFLRETNGALPRPYRLERVEAPPRLFISGNEAFALGAMVAGCRFLAAYPISPATEIMEWLARRLPKYGGVVVQAEDELAAINMAVGAGYAGLRAMTSTSGPGLSLMVEAIGLAGTTETPVVIVDCQRAGPSTGIPTKTEQGDLYLASFGGHGEIPRLVLAPATLEDCFTFAGRAFNLAERYQLPVFVLMDNSLSTRKQTIPPFDLSRVMIERGELLSQDQVEALEDYRRYRLTESGVSPRTLPGTPGGIFMTSGNEHNERGNVTEDQALRTQMVDKRMRKLTRLEEELNPPRVFEAEGASLTLIGWGSTQGVIREAVARLAEEGIPIRHLQFTDLWPVPRAKLLPLVRGTDRVVVVEQNITGQLASLLKMTIGLEAQTILKYDGVPFTPGELVNQLKEILDDGHR